MTEPVAPKKKGLFMKFIRGIEVVGNMLPNPFWLFTFLAIIIVVLSYFLGKAGVSVTYMAAKAGEAPKETTVAVVNLLTYKEMRAFLGDFVKTYMNFAPPGARPGHDPRHRLIEQTGMIAALMRKTVLGAPSHCDGGYRCGGNQREPRLDAGIIFTRHRRRHLQDPGPKPLGRHHNGLCGGERRLHGELLHRRHRCPARRHHPVRRPGHEHPGPTHPLINWYFMFAATIVLTFVTTFVTEKFTIPALGDKAVVMDDEEAKKHALTPEENRGLRWAGIAAIIVIGVILYLTVPQGSFFRADDGTIVPKSPFLSSVVAILFFLFFFIGIAYGYGAGTIKKLDDIPKHMQKGLVGGLSFMVVVLPASMFIAALQREQAHHDPLVNGAHWLERMNLGAFRS